MVEVTGPNPVSPRYPGFNVGVSFYGTILKLQRMTGNLIWLSLINIKRKKFGSIIFFVMAFFIAHTIFLINISRNLLRFPDFTGVRQLFYTVLLSALILSIFILGAFSFLFLHLRRGELGILRIFGVQKSDILFLSTIEIFFISFTGSISGILSIILLISFRIIYLPSFFEGMKELRLLKLIGIGGQTIFGVVIIELIVTLIILIFVLKQDITELLRGSY